MALMERVAMLLRANVNDLIDRAEDPEKMVKQLLLDMENQLLQVKTQVAIAIADEHLLESRRKEEAEVVQSWHRKAELAVSKGEDELARLALERALSHETMQSEYAGQVAEQSAEAAALRKTYNELQEKLKRTQGQCEMLTARNRRARSIARATKAQQALEKSTEQGNGILRDGVAKFAAQIQTVEANSHAARTMLQGGTLEDKFARLEKNERVELLLAELKERQVKLLA